MGLMIRRHWLGRPPKLIESPINMKINRQIAAYRNQSDLKIHFGNRQSDFPKDLGPESSEKSL